jgi:hypothetical protein
VFIILYDNTSGHFTIFQISVLLVVSAPDYYVLQMKLIPPFGDFSLESLLSKTPSVAELWEPNASISIDPSDHHLIK